jgi:hypothetical protein
MSMQVMTRLAMGVCMALLASACKNPTSTFIPPTQPSQNPTPPAVRFSVTGVVAEGARPIEGARIWGWIQGTGGDATYEAQTDAAGRFQLTLLPQTTLWLTTSKDGYVQQCAASPVTVNEDTTLDVQLVSRERLSASTADTHPAVGRRSVSGVIYKITDTGRQPVAGAFVDWEPFWEFSAAFTYSDAQGRYSLCGVPDASTGAIVASSEKRAAWVALASGQSIDIDITIR